jgi:uncharacterized protein
MRYVYGYALFFVFSFFENRILAQQRSAFPLESIPNTAVRYFHSGIVRDNFRISIALPEDYGSSDSTYPVLYFTDANAGFAMLTQMIRAMQLDNEFPKVILVGIGYPTDSLAGVLRNRDLLPDGVSDSVNNKSPAKGAFLFLRFIKEELMPFVRKNYRISDESSYAGISYGGLFGVYVLLHAPQTFQRYIIVSPSIWFKNLVTMKYEQQYASSHDDLHAIVFMSAGELEENEFPDWHMVTNMQVFAEKLASRHYPGLRLESIVLQGETHFSTYPASLSRGLRLIYKQ